MQNDEQAIRDLIASWLAATTDGDLNRIEMLMADDVVFLLPGQSPMIGKAAFAEGFKAAVAKFRIEATSHIQEMCVSGEVAYCWSQMAVVMTPHAGGASIRRAGNVLSVFKKLFDGEWVLFRDANLLTIV